MLTKAEAAAQLGMHEQTLLRKAKHGLISKHVINALDYLYEKSEPHAPVNRSGRCERLVDRGADLPKRWGRARGIYGDESDPETHNRARLDAQRNGLSIFNALIGDAALLAECTTLYSYDRRVLQVLIAE